MHIKAWDQEIVGPANATVDMKTGDTISIAYTDPRGETNVITVIAQHLVMIAEHEGSKNALLIRPSKGCEFVPG